MQISMKICPRYIYNFLIRYIITKNYQIDFCLCDTQYSWWRKFIRRIFSSSVSPTAHNCEYVHIIRSPNWKHYVARTKRAHQIFKYDTGIYYWLLLLLFSLIDGLSTGFCRSLQRFRSSYQKNWQFPKNHTHAHVYEDIRRKGVTKNYNTKYSESMHGPLKVSYQLRSNFKDSQAQVWFLI